MIHFLILAIVGFYSFSTQAAPVLGVLRIPWSVIEHQVSSHQELLNANEVFLIDDFTVASGFGPISLPPVQVGVSYYLNPMHYQSRDMLVSTKFLGIQIQVPAITIQKQMKIVSGGVEVVVNLNASCSPFQLTQAMSSIQALMQWQKHGTKIEAQISSLNFQWPRNSWTVSPIQCVGPAGFADLIQNELNAQLSNADAFKDQVKAVIQNSINLRIGSLLNPFLEPQFMKLQNAQIQYQLNGIDSVSVTGIDFQVYVANAQADFGLAPIDDFKSSPLSSLADDQVSLVFGQLGFQELLKKSLLQQKLQFSLKSFSGFANLMRSRFLQFFLWPDLMRFAKSTNFTLNTQVLPSSSLNFTSNRQWNLKLDMESWIKADRDGVNWSYLQIQSQIKGKFSFTIKDANLELVSKLKSANSEISFGDEYVQHYRPNTAIASWVLDEAIKKLMPITAQSFQIPKIQLESLASFQLRHFRYGTQNEMIFEFVSAL